MTTTDDLIRTATALPIDPNKVYALEIDRWITEQEAQQIKDRWMQATGCARVVVLTPQIRVARIEGRLSLDTQPPA